jgi:hypothetical protein
MLTLKITNVKGLTKVLTYDPNKVIITYKGQTLQVVSSPSIQPLRLVLGTGTVTI